MLFTAEEIKTRIIENHYNMTRFCYSDGSWVVVTPVPPIKTKKTFDLENCDWFWAYHSCGIDISCRHFDTLVQRINHPETIRKTQRMKTDLREYFSVHQESGWSEDGSDWDHYVEMYKQIYGKEPRPMKRKITYIPIEDDR